MIFYLLKLSTKNYLRCVERKVVSLYTVVIDFDQTGDQMKVRVFFFVFTLSFYFGLYSQSEKFSASAEVRKFLEAADSSTNIETSYSLLYKALDLAEEKNDIAGQLDAYVELEELNISERKFSDAVKNGSRALSIYNNSNSKYKRIVKIHSQMSLAFEGMGAYSEAISQRKIILKHQIENPKTKSQEQYFSYSNIGRLFLNLGEYDSALHYFQESLLYAKEMGYSNLFLHAHNDIGLTFKKLDQPDSAVFHYEIAIDGFSSKSRLDEKEAYMLALIKGNMAECLNNSNALKETYFEADIAGSRKYNDAENAVNTYIDYGNYLIEIAKFSKAEYILELGKTLADSLTYVSPDAYIELYDAFTRLYTLQNKTLLALKYRQLQLDVINEHYGKKAIDQLIASYTSYELNKIQDELTIEKILGEKKKAQINELNSKNRLARLRIITISSISVLALIISVLIILRIRSNAKRKSIEKEMKNRILKLELDYNSERLNKSIMSISRKKEFAEELLNRINEIEHIEPSTKNSLKMYVYNELEIDEQVLETESEIQNLGEAFVAALKDKYPQLTENDIKLLGFIKMKLSNKQIAEIKNITPESVKISKNRLRKKLNLAAGATFSSILD